MRHASARVHRGASDAPKSREAPFRVIVNAIRTVAMTLHHAMFSILLKRTMDEHHEGKQNRTGRRKLEVQTLTQVTKLPKQGRGPRSARRP